MKTVYNERRKFRGGEYSYRATNSKLANGMSKTCANQKYNDTTLSLIVKGTLDKLASSIAIWKAGICPCCGEHARNKRILSDRGKLLLKYLRNKEKMVLDSQRKHTREK